ncbi:V-type ATP synthase subunit D [Chlamydia psittaci]|uniref:V-type ATP synthase subunit D n=1 Tax=Chlamydia psittaci TaxID=83554 RepID=UPI00027E58E6|nr:V-type ATP synthase subunit D [Chlamydia psittaci]AFS28239.1 V-type ATPase, D subunit [Chlamydia psittaci NJ1]KPZ36082.1 ATP synthase subunit D [Chlamydia psittaci NJ1]MDS0919267.1 V-type ATP synthase subunit D [Chlamydia psittaci]MDS0989298.1 V-type ATP synthase subunit D [Chlamydia psittaci]MDS0995273.1 V-type ATP synthase subunit D [Chlamydia psittaci]
MSSQVKLTKNAYRLEKVKLSRLETYLPTLKLKKALLQVEVTNAILEASESIRAYEESRESIYAFAELYSVPLYVDAIVNSFKIEKVAKEYENIAGIEVPVIKNIVLTESSYSVLDTPIWVDTLVAYTREFVVNKVRSEVAVEKQRILEDELRNVSIRVNLFEKKLIPETTRMIKKIAIFLSDRSITDVGQVKMAKKKIQQRKEESECA